MAAARKRTGAGKAAVQPSVRVFTTWTPSLLRSAEMQADSGNLRLAATLCDWLLGDDRVRGALDTRVQALLGLDPTFEPSGDKRRSNKAVRALEAEEDWWDGYPESELALTHTWGVLLGIGPSQHNPIVSDDHGGRILPRPEFWHPQHIRFDSFTRRWLTRANDGREVEMVAGDGTWILHTPYGANRPWAMGLWRGLAPWVLLKHLARQDWAIHSEKGALLSAEADKDVKSVKEARAELANDLYERGRNGVAVMAPGWVLKLIETSAGTHQLYERQVELANTAIAVAVRGGNLTTEVSQGGSKAATESQERTGDNAKLRFDAQTITTTYHDQSLIWWADWNFGDPKLAPWPVYPVEPEEDVGAKAEAQGKALETAKKARDLGFTVKPQEFVEEFKLGSWVEAPAELPEPDPIVEPEDPAAEPAPEESDDADDKTDGEANARMVAELESARRAIIVGGPRSGKSTITVRAAERHNREAKHADALVGKLKWSEISEEVSRWVDNEGDWIIEGVSAARALRKWLKRNPEAKLDATVIWLEKPIQARTKRQRAMARGVATVFREIRDELVARGARLIERDADAN